MPEAAFSDTLPNVLLAFVPRLVMAAICDRAREFFGATRRLVDITAGDAAWFADWLRGEAKYAQATVARTLKRMKQLYARAV